VWRSRLAPYEGVTAQALRDVVRWVEENVPPPFYTGCGLSRDNQLVPPATAAERGGVQPVVTAKANGGARADVKVGEAVTFTGQAEQPPGAGFIVSAEWDFGGRGACGRAHGQIDGSSPSIDVAAIHAYEKPGTYFASFRVGAHREGAEGRGLPVLNLARVRVVVHPQRRRRTGGPASRPA
jgi:hypothetical protein